MLEELVNLRKFENLTSVEIDPQKLLAARGQLKRSQVARAVGVSSQHVSNMEKGKSKPSSDLLIRMCFLYGVDCRSLANMELTQ